MKNKILKGITYFAAILTLLAASGLDADGWKNETVCIICSAWLLLFLFANRKRVMNLW